MPFRKSTLNHECLKPPYRNGLVLKGYDVVEYHNLDLDDPGVLGNKKYSYTLSRGGGNYLFYFKNKKNLESFRQNPEAYLPQFGGFCSWGFANEWGDDKKVPLDCSECLTSPPWPWTRHVMGPPADPEYGWSLYQGKLYFNINSHYRKRWENQKDKFIQRASDRWKKYYGDDTKGPLNVHSYPENWRESTSLTPSQVECLGVGYLH